MSRSIPIADPAVLQSRRCHFVEAADIQAAGFRKYDLQITALSCPTEQPTHTHTTLHTFILSNKAGKVTADTAVQYNSQEDISDTTILSLQYLVRIS